VGTIIVTGSASGIGAATAKLLDQQGIPVGCLDTDGPAVQQLAGSLGHAAAVTADIRQEEACFEAFARLGRLLGPISGTVHCAGIFDSQPVDTLQIATLQHVLSVNVLGSLHVARSAARLMENRGGSIVLFSSGTAQRAFGAPAYSASKAAVEALTRECALAWASRRIRVNAIAPGVIETPMSAVSLENQDVHRMVLAHTPMQRLGTAEEVASVCAFLVSDAASYMTGAIIPVDGGYCIV
jgi:NAD(P)-dependent dehydrogenase (short-subunit alcohol dehydrogenase family)